MVTPKTPDFRGPSCLQTPDLTGLLNLTAQLQRGLEFQLSLLSQTRQHSRLRNLLITSVSNTKRARRALAGAVMVTEEETSSRQPAATPKTPAPIGAKVLEPEVPQTSDPLIDTPLIG
jgi:hypothetical protein